MSLEVSELLQRRLKVGVCVKCGDPFTEENVHTPAGWRETRISQMCEDCFDEVTAEPDDDGECEYCGGEGFVELADHPDLWADDCLMEANRLVECPDCMREPPAQRGSDG